MTTHFTFISFQIKIQPCLGRKAVSQDKCLPYGCSHLLCNGSLPGSSVLHSPGHGPPPLHSSVEKVIKERGLLLAIQASVMKGILSFQLPALAKIILKAMRGECNQIALAVSSLPG